MKRNSQRKPAKVVFNPPKQMQAGKEEGLAFISPFGRIYS
jgi:hypothetical protein